MKKICGYCNKEFDALGKMCVQQLYCSRKCQTIKWNKDNPEKYKQMCKEKTNRYREKNPEKVKEQTRRAVESGRANINTKAWYRRTKLSNPEKIKEMNHSDYWSRRDKQLAHMKAYRQTQKGKEVHSASERNRRFSLNSLVVCDFPFTHKHQLIVRRRDDDTCVYCHVTPDVIHFDHIIPQKARGQNLVTNIVVSCAECNCSKNATPLLEWLSGGYCRMKGISLESINPVVLRLLSSQKLLVEVSNR